MNKDRKSQIEKIVDKLFKEDGDLSIYGCLLMISVILGTLLFALIALYH